MRVRVRYIVRGVAIAATVMFALIGCNKESGADSEATTSQTENRSIDLLPYIPIVSSKGASVGNDVLKDNGFNVGIYKMSTDESTAQLYSSCAHVSYNEDAKLWGYDDTFNRYWPADNSTLSFLAHYPAEGEEVGSDGTTPLFGHEVYEAYDHSNGDEDLAFKFNYTVHHDAELQYDLIYALRENVSCPDDKPYSVHLPFCHALTQVAFTAELDPTLGVEMTVYKLVLHNLVYTGTFAVRSDTGDEQTTGQTDGNDDYNNNGVWWFASLDDGVYGDEDNTDTDRNGYLISEFGAKVRNGESYGVDDDDVFADGIALSSTSISITDPDNELMLMPQHITAWDPDTYKPSTGSFYDADDNSVEISTVTRTDDSNGLDPLKAGAYIAISCEITQKVGDETITIHNREKWLYAPLNTAIDYNDDNGSVNEWLAGYKITYNLIFGGGYTTIPGAEYPVSTLTPITVTATASEWNDAGSVPLTY